MSSLLDKLIFCLIFITSSNSLKTSPIQPLQSSEQNPPSSNVYYDYTKMICLFLIWLFIVLILTYEHEKNMEMHALSIPKNSLQKNYTLPELPLSNKLKIYLEGAFLKQDFINDTKNFLSVFLEAPLKGTSKTSFKNLSAPVNFPIASPESFDTSNLLKRTISFDIDESDLNKLRDHNELITLVMKSNVDRNFPVLLKYDSSPLNVQIGVVAAALILIFLYVLIIWEVI